MRRIVYILIFFFSFTFTQEVEAQCSICTKTAQQLGHKPAKGLNSGIIYLMIAPLAIIGFVGYRWIKGGGADPNV
ncbi:MAG: hypothetical protein RL642_1342 [Bacteroidota bacterium]|jgi:hypothetical protein